MALLSSKAENFNPLGGMMIGGYTPGAPNVDFRMALENLLTGPVKVIDPVALNGIDGTTTAKLSYGINVVRVTSSANFAIRMPLVPLKGRTVVVVNAGTQFLRIYASVAGGSMNGVVDGYVDVPPNKLAVPFVCWDNPSPGDWSAPLSLNSIFESAELSVNHVNGVQDVRAGILTAENSAIGAATDGNGNLILTPASIHWRTILVPATAVKLRVYTNIIENDAASNLAGDLIRVWRSSAYKTAANAATSGNRETIYIGANGVQVGGFYPDTNGGTVAGGVVNAPAEVGDVDTFFGDTLVANNPGNQIGVTQFSNAYFTFGIQIPASAVTKLYKFKIILDYV